ncbi:hypothetical protein J5N97_007502 [Dioscorea zingiberensis]|uniref:DUF1639 family protein n=1 Tax=Dioscorea zingiberensis TaxID=325984 RepID=A0A9D5HUL3_9LILI|nr:hypothetical protein J5N97_007502 [Dioscorea zingiberensis]
MLADVGGAKPEDHRIPYADPLPPRESKSRLHNFSFPTRSWGSTRLLRCSKPTSGSEPIAGDPKAPSSSPPATAASTPEEEASSPARPWNLRTRRAACNAPMEKASPMPSKSPSPIPVEKAGNGGRTVRLRSDSVERKRFSVQLTREEIEEDFYSFKGTKPPRRPKKRPRVVQRQLDALFPGLWLSEVSLETYRISD